MVIRKYDPKKIGATLLLLRKEKESKEGRKVSQQEIADAIGCDRVSYARYENGLRVPERYNISELAYYYKVSEKFITGESKYRTIEEEATKKLGAWKMVDETYRIELLKKIQKDTGLIERRLTNKELNDLNELYTKAFDSIESIINEYNQEKEGKKK